MDTSEHGVSAEPDFTVVASTRVFKVRLVKASPTHRTTHNSPWLCVCNGHLLLYTPFEGASPKVEPALCGISRYQGAINVYASGAHHFGRLRL